MTNKVEDILLPIQAYKIFIPQKEQNDYITERFGRILVLLGEDRLSPAIVDYSFQTLKDAKIALSEIRTVYKKCSKKAEKKLLSDSNVVVVVGYQHFGKL